MLELIPADTRGAADFGWLQSRHTFSFGNYFDRTRMGVSVLRVINDDTVAPGAGFATHGHEDMEIISYVLEGAIEHKDSEGNQFILPAGEVQRMSAGTGITHSEFNHSKTEPVKFLQIWIQPAEKGLQPSYEQRKIPQNGPLTPLVTPDGKANSLRVHQDASIYRLELSAEEKLSYNNDRTVYVHVIAGQLNINSKILGSGDGIIADEHTLDLRALNQNVIALVFVLPNQS